MTYCKNIMLFTTRASIPAAHYILFTHTINALKLIACAGDLILPASKYRQATRRCRRHHYGLRQNTLSASFAQLMLLGHSRLSLPKNTGRRRQASRNATRRLSPIAARHGLHARVICADDRCRRRATATLAQWLIEYSQKEVDDQIHASLRSIKYANAAISTPSIGYNVPTGPECRPLRHLRHGNSISRLPHCALFIGGVSFLSGTDFRPKPLFRR